MIKYKMIEFTWMSKILIWMILTVKMIKVRVLKMIQVTLVIQ
jgi:hypothetical protein